MNGIQLRAKRDELYKLSLRLSETEASEHIKNSIFESRKQPITSNSGETGNEEAVRGYVIDGWKKI